MSFLNSLKKASKERGAKPSTIYGVGNEIVASKGDESETDEGCEKAERVDEMSFEEMYLKGRPE